MDHTSLDPIYLPNSDPHLNFDVISALEDPVRFHDSYVSSPHKEQRGYRSYHDHQLFSPKRLPVDDEELLSFANSSSGGDPESYGPVTYPSKQPHPEQVVHRRKSSMKAADLAHKRSYPSSVVGDRPIYDHDFATSEPDAEADRSSAIGLFSDDPFLNDSKLSCNSSALDNNSETPLSEIFKWKQCAPVDRSTCPFLHDANVRTSSDSSASSSGQFEMKEDEGLTPSDKLEMELQELLGNQEAPVPMASIPRLYHSYFGKTLQAEGYIHGRSAIGKSGCTLKEVLARFPNVVKLTGGHADGGLHVIVADDAQGRRKASVPKPVSSKIYMTFLEESTFTDDDVIWHFSAYGPVQEVRIPVQKNARRYGFVSFVHPESVDAVLCDRRPHYICGAHVRVKPYRTRENLGNCKNEERLVRWAAENWSLMSPASAGQKHQSLIPFPASENSREEDRTRDFRWRIVEEKERALDLERKRLMGLRNVYAQKLHSLAEATVALSQAIAGQVRADALTELDPCKKMSFCEVEEDFLMSMETAQSLPSWISWRKSLSGGKDS